MTDFIDIEGKGPRIDLKKMSKGKKYLSLALYIFLIHVLSIGIGYSSYKDQLAIQDVATKMVAADSLDSSGYTGLNSTQMVIATQKATTTLEKQNEAQRALELAEESKSDSVLKDDALADVEDLVFSILPKIFIIIFVMGFVVPVTFRAMRPY